MNYTYGFQPGMQGAQGMQQPNYLNANYAPQQAAQRAQAGNVNWIYVCGVNGAREQIVQPGQIIWMMDNNEPMIYVKAVDGMGSATLRGFRFEEIDLRNPQSEGAQGSANAGELAAINKRIGKLEREYADLINALGGAKNEPIGTDHGTAGGR